MWKDNKHCRKQNFTDIKVAWWTVVATGRVLYIVYTGIEALYIQELNILFRISGEAPHFVTLSYPGNCRQVGRISQEGWDSVQGASSIRRFSGPSAYYGPASAGVLSLTGWNGKDFFRISGPATRTVNKTWVLWYARCCASNKSKRLAS